MKCDFCFRACDIKEGKSGFCRIRRCESGKIITSRGVAAVAVDPIEKKPLYHFLPGTRTYSLALPGCSFDCDFCQNSRIARDFDGIRVLDADAAEIANEAVLSRSPSISFTYTEPIVWQDYMIDVAKLAKDRGLRTVMVSNGAMSDAAAERIIPLIDAYNIDLKGDAAFYRDYCHGSFDAVVKGIERIIEKGKHIEVTTLVIEGIHTESMIRSLGKILSGLSVKVWHLSRFFPARFMDERAPTSESFLESCTKAARESSIPFIYRGNSAYDDETLCPECKSPIDRVGFSGRCLVCGKEIYGVWR